MANELINYEDKGVIATLKQTVALNATDAEFAMFTQFCKSTGLNPFKKEIWFIKAGGRVQLMTGVNGYWSIANSHPQFDGTEQDIEVDESGAPVKATCKVYRKDRRFPSVGIALMKEYKKGTPIWSSMPSVMLMKCAESVALRKAFPQELNGLYTEEEMPQTYAAPALKSVVIPKEPDTDGAELAHEMADPNQYFWYAFPEAEVMEKKQLEFLKRRDCQFDIEKKLWFCPKELGGSREGYRTECPYLDEGEATDNGDEVAA